LSIEETIRDTVEPKRDLSLFLQGVNMKTILLSEFFILVQIIVAIFIYEVIWRDVKDKIKDKLRNKK
tara:strand:- start:711 stop:911 length:201 start_codon:yes stop_codon:yes gene_type:complete